MKIYSILISFFLFTSLVFCKKNNIINYQKPDTGISTIYVFDGFYTKDNKEDKEKPYRMVPVDIFVPKNISRCNSQILMLPGWNFPRDDWYKKTNILKEAEENGFCLVFPEMGKAVYASRYFPETKRKVFIKPSLTWINENLMKHLQTVYGMFLKVQNNFIMGLSTGARGVALVSLTNQGLFKAGCALSGDYDQSAMPKDRLMSAIYGNYEQHKDRWKKIDNPKSKSDQWAMPLYLGHGRKDKIVPFSQSKEFYKAIKKNDINIPIIFNAPETEHNYTYWAAEIRPSFIFFNKHKD